MRKYSLKPSFGKKCLSNFAEDWIRTDAIPDAGSYYPSEGQALYQSAWSIPGGSRILEIGVGYGRSASLLAAVAKVHGHELILVDPYCDNHSPLERAVVNLHEIGIPFTFHVMRTDQCRWTVPDLHLIHIDGDHEASGVALDCTRFLPHLVSGGLVAAHDYGTIAGVQPVMDQFTEGWERVALVDRLSIWRKP